MSTPRDDDALSWEGDDDPTLTTGAGGGDARATPRDHPIADRDATDGGGDESGRLPAGFTAVGKGSSSVVTDEHDPQPLSGAALVAIGMIAAAYIFFAVGWGIAGVRLLAVPQFPVPAPTLVAMTIAAALAPIVWFVAVFALTRRSRAWLRLVWLAAGLLVLLPWPFLVTGALA